MSDTWSESPFTFRYIVNIMRDEGLAAGRRPWAWAALPGVGGGPDSVHTRICPVRLLPWLRTEKRATPPSQSLPTPPAT